MPSGECGSPICLPDLSLSRFICLLRNLNVVNYLIFGVCGGSSYSSSTAFDGELDNCRATDGRMFSWVALQQELLRSASTYQPRPSSLPTAFFCGLMLGAHPPATACRCSKALALSAVPVLVLCVGVMMLSLDPGRGCNVVTMQLALVLTGCSGDIGLPLELRLCFEPCVQCAGQFIGRKTRFDARL